ncbi:hypothetical protein C8Q74DRAFT_1250380 [Fomes fomentarius]|nr:hypothetical protein C8Q74DRAFT_1250380 [Fomes fomentarius]
MSIIPYLCTCDVLAYGTTCHFLRPLAVRHAIHDVQFSSAARLAKFCIFMLEDSQARIPHLRNLTVLSGITTEPRTFYASLSPLARLLTRAFNLASLSLPCADLLLTIEPDLFHAITKLTSLTSLALTSFGNDTQAMLLQLHCAPTLQRLLVAEEWTMYQEDAVRTMSLQLSKVEFDDGEPAQGTWWTSFDHIRGDLRSLRLLRTPRPVRALEIDVVLDRQSDWDPAPVFDVLSAASPQRLSIGMQANFNHPLWTTYAPAMPRLRYLELVVSDGDPGSHDLENWLDNISHPGPATLLALAVYIQRPPQDPLAHSPIPSAGPIDTQLAARLFSALARSIPSLRLLALSIGTQPPKNSSTSAYDVFSGEQFNWWCAEQRSSPSDSDSSVTKRTVGSVSIAKKCGDGDPDYELNYERVRGWRRIAEDRGARLFSALREADFEKLGDVDAFLTPFV